MPKNSILIALVGALLVSCISCISYTSEQPDAAASQLSLDRGPVRSATPTSAQDLTAVGFAAREHEPSDAEVITMVDQVIEQTLGPRGLANLVKPGDHVVLKVNNVGPYIGAVGSKGRGIITDPRIVRHVAEAIRKIIGFAAPADLVVCDSLFYPEANPSRSDRKTSFYRARLDRGESSVYYDQDGDGILDGESQARLVNLDGFSQSERYCSQVRNHQGKYIDVWFPKILRTRAQALIQDQVAKPTEYCDVLIGLPVLKSHGIAGVTGALKLQYGFRPMTPGKAETGRFNHSGVMWDLSGMHNQQNLLDYLVAEHLVRDFDFAILDCLTGNRRGPLNPSGGITTVNDSEAVDFIMVNAIAASRDSVACDTLETLLAGYSIVSIGLLETAYQSKLGTNRPLDILISGQEAFGRHRAWMAQQSGQRYPFADGWGGAKANSSEYLTALYGPGISFEIQKLNWKNGNLAIEFVLAGLKPESPQPVRLDLYQGDNLLACQELLSKPDANHPNAAFQGSFMWHADAAGNGAPTNLTLAIWDTAGNCRSIPVPETARSN